MFGPVRSTPGGRLPGVSDGLLGGLLGVFFCMPDCAAAWNAALAGCVLDFWIDGSDGTDGLLPLERFGWLARERTFLPPPSPPRSRTAPLILSGSASLRWFARNAKYESGMSSKSMTRSHSSQRHVGGSCGGGPMSAASTSRTFSSSHSGQKYGT